MAEEGTGSGESGTPGEGDAGAGGENAHAWLGENPSAELVQVVEKKGWKGPVDAVKAYENAERLIGADKAGRAIVMPKDDATPEERAAFFDKLGRPSDAADYKFDVPEGSPEGYADGARAKFHELGLTSAQAEALVAWNNEFATTHGTKAAEAAEAARVADEQAQEAALKTEWGAKYDENVAQAQAAAKAFGLDEAQLDKLEGALGFSGLMKFMQNLGARVGEGQLEGGQGGTGGAMTPAEAQSALKALNSDAEFMKAWTDKRHPGHEDAVARKTALVRMTVGEAA